MKTKSQKKGCDPIEVQKIMQAALSLMDKPVVTQNDIARKAGVRPGRVTICCGANDELVKVVEKAVKTPEQRILAAIKYFNDNGEKAGAITLMEKALVSTSGFYGWYKKSKEIKKGIDELDPQESAKAEIITAIKIMCGRGEVLTDGAIIKKSGVSERAFYKYKADPDVVLETDKGIKPPTASKKMLDRVNELITSNVLVTTKSALCATLKIRRNTLWLYEKSDKKLKKAIRELILQSRKSRNRLLSKESAPENNFSPVVKERIYNALRALKRQLELGEEVSKEMVCRLSGITMDVLIAYEANDPVLAEDVIAVLPLPPMRKIEIELQRMSRVNQTPTIEAIAMSAKLPKDIVQKVIDDNKPLRDIIEKVRNFIAQTKKSFTYGMS